MLGANLERQSSCLSVIPNPLLPTIPITTFPSLANCLEMVRLVILWILVSGDDDDDVYGDLDDYDDHDDNWDDSMWEFK